MKKLVLLFGLLALTACGPDDQFRPIDTSNLPAMDQPGVDTLIVHSRAVLNLTVANGQTVSQKIMNLLMPVAFAVNPQATQPITVTNGANTTWTVSNAAFIIPTISNAILDFGSLNVTALNDNNTKVCGGGGNNKCTTAVIRMYTTGTTGAGLYSAVDAYGNPITGSQTSGTVGTIGLGVANAYELQTWTIPNSRHTVTKADFAAPTTYNVKVDMTDAGVGTFTTTIVLEYGVR